MAIGTPVLQQAAGATAATTTTASFTPNANTRLFAWAISWRAVTATPNDPVVTDSLGSTWTAVPGSTASFLSGSVDNIVAKLFYLDIGSSPSAMTVTCAATSSSRMSVVTFEVSGGDTDFSNIFATNSPTGDPSGTLSAMASTSAGFGLAAAVGNNNFTPPSGYTELYDLAPGITRRLTVCYDLASPGTTLTWASNNSDSVAIGFEYKEASGGGGQNITGALFSNTNSFEAATVSATADIAGSLFSNTNTFFGATVINGQNISGGLFTNANSFNGAVVSATYSITGSLFSNSNTFYGATVSQGGSTQSITGALFSNTNSFFTSATTKTYSIAGGLFTNTNSFFPATVSTTYGITGSLFTNSNSFYSAAFSASYNIAGSLFQNNNTFFGAAVSSGQGISGSLFQNQNSFFTATVILPSVFVNVTGMGMTMAMGNASPFVWERIVPLPDNWTKTSPGSSEIWTPVPHSTKTWTKR